MELPDIGKHCSSPNCKQLDFLPLQCKCGKIFCSEHFQEHVPQCLDFGNQTDVLKKIENLHHCEHDVCKVKSIVPFFCEKCSKYYCITHRHITSCEVVSPEAQQVAREKMQIPVRQFNEVKEHVDKMIDENINKAMKNSKKLETARKVQLMRLKNKAVGQKQIPTTGRIYFDINYKNNNTLNNNLAVYVAKNWSLGRVIDAVAEECKLKNANNVMNSKKLRLFTKRTRQILSVDMAKNIEEVMKEIGVVDGDSLIITYVDNDCTEINEEVY